MDYLIGSLYEIILFIFITIIWICVRVRNKSKGLFAFDLLYSFFVFLLLAYTLNKWSLFNYKPVLEYISTVRILIEILAILLLSILLLYIIIGFFGKRYSLRVDNFNIGGINILFDKSNEIYKKTVGNFIASKRTLFNFNKKRDNISQVLDAYYSTYKHIKDNLELLDPEKDKEIYDLSTEILQKLNYFLSKHQSDYRRWFDYIINKDCIKISDDQNIIVHETTIELVQENYYRYEEIIRDIKNLNCYFNSDNIKEKFNIKKFDWSEEKDA